MLKFKDLTSAAQKAAEATAATIAASSTLKGALDKLTIAAQGLPSLEDGDIVKIAAQVAVIKTFSDKKSEKSTEFFAFPATIVRGGKKFRDINVAASSFVRGAYIDVEEEPEEGSIEISELKPRFVAKLEFLDVNGIQLPAIAATELKISKKKVFVPDFDNDAFQKGSTTVHAWKTKDWGVTL